MPGARAIAACSLSLLLRPVWKVVATFDGATKTEKSV
jgi:hypothetical protein